MWLRGSILFQLILGSLLEGRCYLLRKDSGSLGGCATSNHWITEHFGLGNGRRLRSGARLGSAQGDRSTLELAEIDDGDIEASLNLPQTIWPKRKNFIRGAIERQIRIQKFWKDYDIYRRLLERRLSNFENKRFTDSKATSFTRVILDGPPYANGDAHFGHFLNKTIKDVLLKAMLLDGKLALFLPGWDCHGIPIESKVMSTTEHALGDLRNGLTEAGVPRAVEVRQRCSQVAFRSIQSQTNTFERAGIWGFWKEFYATYHFYYEKKVMDAFKELHDRDLIYRARCPQHYSAMSKSVLADCELLSEERDVLTAVVAFQVTNPKPVLEALDFHRPLAAVKLVCWTTLPWTIPGNRGLMVDEDTEYDVFYRDGNLFVLNNNAEFGIFQPKQYVGKVKGDILVGQTVFNPINGGEYKVHDNSGILDNKGTGIVHAAPAHGFVDFRMFSSGKGFTIRDTFVKDPNVICNIIDENERYYNGLHVMLDGASIHDIDAKRLEELLGDDLLLARVQRIPVDVDWRFGNRTHVRITKQWCLSLRERNACLERLKDIEMYPEASRNYLQNIIKHRAQDWCLSRQRVWGTPIPVTFVDAAALENEELAKLCSMDEACEGMKTGEYRLAVDIETLPNYELGDRVFRKLNFRTDTVDVWFESALAQRVSIVRLREILRDMAQRCTHEKAFTFRDLVPEYAVEGQDQFRGWYQSSIILNTLLGGKSPVFARRVITHGFVNDDSGRKLSKRNQPTDAGTEVGATDSGIATNTCLSTVEEKETDNTAKSGIMDDLHDHNKSQTSSESPPTSGEKTSSEVSGGSPSSSLMTMLGTDYYDDVELIDLDNPKCVGADVLRLWACSNDFLQKDIQLNQSNLREARDFARKVANFFKYAIGVTHDCKINNDRCRLRVSNFNSIDIHFLKLSFDLVQEVRPYFREGRFHKVVRALEVFLTKFSNVYLSYSKDALYCDVKHGCKRTSVQIIIRKIMRNVLGVVAPLMPHMAEDIFQIISPIPSFGPKRHDQTTVWSVFGERWRKLPVYLERVNVGGIDYALQLRNLVNSMNVKTDDQDLTVVCDDDETLKRMLELETKYKLDFRLLLNVSEVKLRLGPDNMHDQTTKRGNGYSIYLEPTNFEKCRRCWLYRQDVTNGFCERCSDICTMKSPAVEDVEIDDLTVDLPPSDLEVPSEYLDDRISTSSPGDSSLTSLDLEGGGDEEMDEEEIDDEDIPDPDGLLLEPGPNAGRNLPDEPPLSPFDPRLFKSDS